MLNWKTAFLKQNTFSTDAPHAVDYLNSLCFAESFFVLKILTVDLWLKPFNSCVKCFTFKRQEVFFGVYGSSLGRKQFCSDSCWVLQDKSHLYFLAGLSLCCLSWFWVPWERVSGSACTRSSDALSPLPGWPLHQVTAMQDPAWALMLDVALVFSSALPWGHSGQQSPCPGAELGSLGRPLEPFAVCPDPLLDQEGAVQTGVWPQPPPGE